MAYNKFGNSGTIPPRRNNPVPPIDDSIEGDGYAVGVGSQSQTVSTGPILSGNQDGANGGADYLKEFNAQKAAQAKTFQLDKSNPGQSVNTYLQNNLGAKSPNRVKTEEESRQQQRYITAIGDVLRHGANLYYTSRGAKPQQIVNQTDINDARWKADDAEKAAKAKQDLDMSLRLQKMASDQKYRDDNIALREQGNQINLMRAGFDAERLGMAKEEQPYKLAERAAGIESKQAQTEHTKMRTELEPKRLEEDIRSHKARESAERGRLALGWANHRLAKQKMSQKAKITTGKNGTRMIVTPSGTRYVISKDYYNNVKHVYDLMVKSNQIKKIEEVNENDVSRPKAKPTKDEMLAAVAEGADTKAGHMTFVYWGDKFGYEYLDGMTDAKRMELGVPIERMKGQDVGLSY